MNTTKTALNPAEFLDTVYLGDRACKAIRIESWERKVVLEVDDISWIRSSLGPWQFSTDEDIENGRIVFTGVESIQFDPSGPVPNDWIEVSAKQVDGLPGGRWLFEASIGAGAPDGSGCPEVVVRIVGADVHIEDPARPGVKIRD